MTTKLRVRTATLESPGGGAKRPTLKGRLDRTVSPDPVRAWITVHRLPGLRVRGKNLNLVGNRQLRRSHGRVPQSEPPACFLGACKGGARASGSPVARVSCCHFPSFPCCWGRQPRFLPDFDDFLWLPGQPHHQRQKPQTDTHCSPVVRSQLESAAAQIACSPSRLLILPVTSRSTQTVNMRKQELRH